MISMHTSPLATPGVGDAGGSTCTSPRWPGGWASGAQGRRLHPDRIDPTPDIVELNEHTRVIDIPAGPPEPVAKEDLPDLVHGFGAQLDAAMPGYDLIHSHYWLSGMVGVQLAARHGIPLVHTDAHHGPGQERGRGTGALVEPDDRERGEAAVVAAARALTANTADEAAELQRHYGARAEQIVIVPRGWTCTPSTPVTSRSRGPSSASPRTPR